MSKREENPEGMRTSDIGLSRLAGITGERLSEADVQRGIDKTLREIVSRPYNPQRLDPPETVRPIDAPTVTTAGEKVTTEKGWYSPKPLAPSRRTDELIEKLADHFQPHEPKSPLRGGDGK
jgi:hypothetical protein